MSQASNCTIMRARPMASLTPMIRSAFGGVARPVRSSSTFNGSRTFSVQDPYPKII